MLIRVAASTDVKAIGELADALFAEDAGTRDPYTDISWPARHGSHYYGALIADPRARVIVAESPAGDVIGVLVGRLTPPNPLRPGTGIAELESMYVRPEHRSLGVGEQFVGAFRAWADDHEVDLLTVTAFARNKNAQRFYERLGFIAHSVTYETAT